MTRSYSLSLWFHVSLTQAGATPEEGASTETTSPEEWPAGGGGGSIFLTDDWGERA